MFKYQLRTNYNVLLLSLVDYLSNWSIYITDNQIDIFQQLFGENKKDQQILNTYSKVRQSLDWVNEVPMLNWAYNGFNKHPKFSDLLPYLKYFEDRVDNQKYSIKDYLQKRSIDNTNLIKKLEPDLDSLFDNKLTKKLEQLFKISTPNTTLPIYLTISLRENSIQGGANGNGVSVQVPPNYNTTNTLPIIKSTITHEILHKIINNKKYSKVFETAESKKILNMTMKNIYPDKLKYFYNEIIVHTLSERILTKENIKHKIEYYKKQNNSKLESIIRILESIKILEPILLGYLNNNISITETRENLNNAFLDIYKKLTLVHADGLEPSTSPM